MVPICDDAKIESYGEPLRDEGAVVPYVVDVYRASSGYGSNPLYPGRSMICAKLRVGRGHLAAWRTEGDRIGLLPYLWAVTSEDGRFPPASWSKIELEPSDGRTHPE